MEEAIPRGCPSSKPFCIGDQAFQERDSLLSILIKSHAPSNLS